MTEGTTQADTWRNDNDVATSFNLMMTFLMRHAIPWKDDMTQFGLCKRILVALQGAHTGAWVDITEGRHTKLILLTAKILVSLTQSSSVEWALCWALDRWLTTCYIGPTLFEQWPLWANYASYFAQLALDNVSALLLFEQELLLQRHAYTSDTMHWPILRAALQTRITHPLTVKRTRA